MLLTIEKLIYGGDGLARLPAASDTATKDEARRRGKAVFVPFVLADEKVEAFLTEQKPGFARAHAESIIEPSPHRIPPGCPHFTRCGGCHYQHAAYERQLTIKKEILRETLRRMAKLDLRSTSQSIPRRPGIIATARACRFRPAPPSPRDISSSPRTICSRSKIVPSVRR